MDIQKASALFFVLITSSLYAMQVPSSSSNLAISAALGSLNGTADEYVYLPNGTMISHLIWDMRDDTLFKAAVNYPFNSWVNINLSGFINIDNGKALMNDYDWQPPTPNFSDWSHHPNTNLRQANEVDISLNASFLHMHQLSLAGMLGYQRNLYSFLAKGGCFIYNFGLDVGCFAENLHVIGYRQSFSAPYIGLAGKYKFSKWQLEVKGKYSNQVVGRDKDQHYLRELTFYEGSNHFTFYNVSLSIDYLFTPQLKLLMEGTANYIPEHRMGTVQIDNFYNERMDFVGPQAGFSNKNYLLSVGLNYTLP